MSMVGGNGMSLCRVAVEFRPGRPLARSSLLACLAASTMIVGIGFGVAVRRIGVLSVISGRLSTLGTVFKASELPYCF